MEIYFFRHGEKEDNSENPKLTQKGIKQSKFLAKKLKNIKFDEFYCSDLDRTKQTSEIISKLIKIKPKIDKRLNEFTSDIYQSNMYKLGVESCEEAEQERYNELKSFLGELSKDKLENKKILIAGHGHTNRLILVSLLELSFKNIYRLAQSEAALNQIYWDSKFNNWRLSFWNDKTHLPAELE